MFRKSPRFGLAAVVMGTALAATAAAIPASAAARPFLSHFSATRVLATTVPPSGKAAGDQNPYGVAVVSRTMGKLVKGDVLVSNFNNAANQQGTGSSIVEVSPSGSAHVLRSSRRRPRHPQPASRRRSSRCAVAS